MIADSSQRRTLYPEIEPYRTGTPRVSDLHELYVEESGNPQGKPVVLARSRIECHYFVNGAFFDHDGQLITNVGHIRHIPAVIVQRRYDVVCPMTSAWALAQVERPSSVILWLQHGPSARLLANLASQHAEITHELLDGLPQDPNTHYIRETWWPPVFCRAGRRTSRAWSCG